MGLKTIKLEDSILIISFIVFFILFVGYVFGNSPTFDQLTTGLFFLLFGWLFSINSKLSRMDSKLSRHLGVHERLDKAKSLSNKGDTN